MALLDCFNDAQRALFEGVAERIEIDRGDLLLKKGDPGGDVFIVLDGTVEVLDRNNPDMIVARINPGEVVGEMAFIDDSPRSVDVRAGDNCTILRWSRDDLANLLRREPMLAARFYEGVAIIASTRLRRLTAGVTSRAYSRGQSVSQEGLQRIKDEARDLSESIKSRFIQVETVLRNNPADSAAIDQVRGLLDLLEARVHEVFTQHPEPEASEIASEVLCRELHPYLVRSGLAERCIRRPQGVTGTAEILAHVLVNTAGGDGQLGEVLDRWLLDRPTLAALRAFREPTIDAVKNNLPSHRNRRVLLVNAGTGSLVAGLTEALAGVPTVLTVLDQSRDALAFLGAAGMDNRSQGIEIATLQENLARFALGGSRHSLPPQDVVLVHGILEYMPERIGVSLVNICRNTLHKDGVLVASALGPSADQWLLDRLLSWPTIRRGRAMLTRLVNAGGMHINEHIDVTSPGLLIAASASAAA
jgi:CRP-like cAMP-binding protein